MSCSMGFQVLVCVHQAGRREGRSYSSGASLILGGGLVSQKENPVLVVKPTKSPLLSYGPSEKEVKKNLKWVHWDQNGRFKNEFAAVPN